MTTILGIVSFVALGLLIGTLFRVKTLQRLLAESAGTIEQVQQQATTEVARLRKAEEDLGNHYASEAARLQTEAAASIRQAETRLNLELEKTKAGFEAGLMKAQELLDGERAKLAREEERIRGHYELEARNVWEEANADLQTARKELEALRKYEGLVNAEAEIAQMLNRALAESSELRDQARLFLDSTKTTCDAHRAKASQEAAEKQNQAEAVLYQATQDAGRLLAQAEKRAEEVAGEAYLALHEKTELEKALEAIRNAIDGYGDRYIAPTRSLLDELAEQFGHTAAGNALKAARAVSKRMAENREAADCNYVDEERRVTAIRFVADAFNGHVDAILARTRHDNHGTLAQEIRDAFQLVNHHGEAFRNARILPVYLEARLLELRYGTIAQEMKLQEREEQRRIREQIREEEKARREYERAMREAAKEEDLLRTLMAKAELAAAEATATEKSRYEKQLQELANKLKEAEERNQRAISMAQQTRRGHVYVISNIGSFGEHVYKIGLTRRLEPLDRIRELGDSSVPFEFDVHALIFSEDAPALETKLHNHFLTMQVNKVNHRKEFFRVDLSKIRNELEGMGIQATWTMAAEAAEYRETQAIERAIEMNPGAREDWIKRQVQLELVAPLGSESEASEGREEFSSSRILSGTEPKRVGI